MTSVEAISGNGFSGVSIIGSAGNDALDFSAIGLDSISLIDGGSGNDIIIGTSGADTFALGRGNDIISGGAGDDNFMAGASNGVDSIDGGAGYDRVLATAGGLSIGLTSFASVEEISANGFAGVKLAGSTGADSLDFSAVTLTGILQIDGAAGNDVITGSAGDDRISGGTGLDVLSGGLGIDTFLFATTTESGLGATKADHILDFLSGTDVIDLSAIDADTTILGNQDFTFIGEGVFTGLGQLRIGIDADGHTALFGNTTGTLAADFQISFDNNPVLLPADIHL
jgi:Ca2+-binding RTX toxin-like protein